jgi:hypothetical protein
LGLGVWAGFGKEATIVVGVGAQCVAGAIAKVGLNKVIFKIKNICWNKSCGRSESWLRSESLSRSVFWISNRSFSGRGKRYYACWNASISWSRGGSK